MNLQNYIYELYGYVKAISDKGREIEYSKEGEETVKGKIGLPDESQWKRIAYDLQRIIVELSRI